MMSPDFIPYERLFSLVFWEEESLVGMTHLPEIVGQTDPVEAKTPIFNLYSLVAPQP